MHNFIFQQTYLDLSFGNILFIATENIFSIGAVLPWKKNKLNSISKLSKVFVLFLYLIKQKYASIYQIQKWFLNSFIKLLQSYRFYYCPLIECSSLFCFCARHELHSDYPAFLSIQVYFWWYPLNLSGVFIKCSYTFLIYSKLISQKFSITELKLILINFVLLNIQTFLVAFR